ncbi:hypothetical protein PpBr36_02499 [Pyricularia pennisetigena]|uniref:hypothetical protein n=1 Tax=Pyricularia pennisetigena TaxID=1578925 RepID=UPI00114F81AF|nr:hypothetical protein PpBr36_02499 [Pyricularia pennisetigena]TLS31418.1 hypothetical protein PpBr36_02499 [Pyricularia pennisetigena]
MGLPLYQPPEKVEKKTEDKKAKEDDESSTGGLKHSLPGLETMNPQTLRDIINSSMNQRAQESQLPGSQVDGDQENSCTADYYNGNWGLWVAPYQRGQVAQRLRSGQSLNRAQRPTPLRRENASTNRSTIALTNAAYYDPDNHVRHLLPTIPDVEEEGEDDEEELTSLQRMLQPAMSLAVMFARHEMLMLITTPHLRSRFTPTLAPCEESTEEIDDGKNEAELRDWDFLNALDDLEWDRCDDDNQ